MIIYVIIAGDLNVDFAKARCNSILETFMPTFDLVRGDTSSDITFAYRWDDHQSSSWVYHIICSLGILNTIGNVMSSESVDNFQITFLCSLL